MSQGFYELLGVDQRATSDQVHSAYQKRLAELVRRLRAARRQGADVSILETRERELKEAVAVLTDPPRRRSYDAYRKACVDGVPEDAEGLWKLIQGSMVDPVSAAGVATVRALTDLPMGDPLPLPKAARPTRPPLPPRPEPVPRTAPPPPPPPKPPEPKPPAPEPAPPKPRAPRLEVPLPTPDSDLLVGLGLDEDPGDDDVSLEIDDPETIDPLDGLGIGLLDDEEDELEDEPLDEVDRLSRMHGFDGNFLRDVREHRGMSLDDLSKATRISLRYLEAMEENGYDRLPAATFVRGYIKQVASTLDISDRGVIEGYMALFSLNRG